jgi:D-amino-acid dehydrogenase
METLRASGSTQRLEQLGPRETLEAEPVLDPGVIGAIIAHGERRVRPELLTAGLERALRTMGAEIHEQTPVTRLIRDGAKWIVETGASSHRAEAVVLANGVATTDLLGKLGTSLPVVAAKGYSRTYSRDPANGSSAPRGALYLESPKVAISVFDGGVRVSGTLELGAKGLTRSNRRLTAIADAARRALSGWRMPEHPADWAGMRSLSPDGLPFIGAVPGVPAVHVATAHGTLGITLAPLTGELLAPLVLEGARNELTNAFDPARGQVHATTGGLQ